MRNHMEKDNLKEVMLDQREFFFSKKSLVQRDVNLVDFIKSRQIVVITGIRRCGKSSLLYLIKEILQRKDEDILYFNFDDERLNAFKPDDFNTVYLLHLEIFKPENENRLIFFFDEVQNVQGWEKFLNRMYERGIKIFITGSNACLLSSEIASSLTGRNLTISLYPFSFIEHLRIVNIDFDIEKLTTTQKAKVLSEFNNYCKFGGFPIVTLEKNLEIIKSYYQDIIYRDVIARFRIAQVEEIKQIGLYLMSNIAKPFSYKTLLKVSGVKSLSSIKNYLDYFRASFLFYYLRKFDYSVKKQILNPRKVYSSDIAFCSQIGFKFSENYGYILENLVFLELKRKGYEIFYHKEDYECDFVVRKGYKIIQAIQVTKDLTDETVRLREYRGLVSALKKYSLSDGYILTKDTEGLDKFQDHRILIIPVWKWLLHKSNI